MSKPKITDKNLYELLGILKSATDAEIRTAYRKTALKCHPDKNPDNPNAAALFRELSDAFEVLSDASAKAAYDQTLKAKEALKLRTRELDAKRRKLKEDLERREQAAKDKVSKKLDVPDEQKLQREIERLRKEGSKSLLEEQEIMRAQILREQQERLSFVRSSVPQADSALVEAPRLTIKWSSKVSFGRDNLMKICSQYGPIAELVPLKKSALVEFRNQADAEAFYASESGKSDENGFTLKWVSKVVPRESRTPDTRQQQPNGNAPNASGSNLAPSFEEFEAMVLKNLSAAAEAQKLATSVTVTADSSLG